MSSTLIPPLPYHRRRRGSVGKITALTALALCAVATAPRAAHAQFAMVATTLTGTTYSVSITNNTLVELAEVDITFTTRPTLTSLTAPTGFTINYDQPSGNIVFAEDTGTFAPGSTISPFTFMSGTILTPRVIEGLNLNGQTLGSVGGNKFPAASGQTQTTNLSAAPEPASLGLLAFAAMPGLALLRRRVTRRHIASDLSKG